MRAANSVFVTALTMLQVVFDYDKAEWNKIA